jgi:hypothetical protein
LKDNTNNKEANMTGKMTDRHGAFMALLKSTALVLAAAFSTLVVLSDKAYSGNTITIPR